MIDGFRADLKQIMRLSRNHVKRAAKADPSARCRQLVRPSLNSDRTQIAKRF